MPAPKEVCEHYCSFATDEIVTINTDKSVKLMFYSMIFHTGKSIPKIIELAMNCESYLIDSFHDIRHQIPNS
jgi:hypothetical protein